MRTIGSLLPLLLALLLPAVLSLGGILLLSSPLHAQGFETKLTASDGAAEEFFGCSVSISGDRAVIGALGEDNYSGSAYIFRWNGTAWVEEAKLTASDGAAYDYFGLSVSIDSNRAIIGASRDDDNGSNSGSAYIFKWNGAAWVEEAKLTASDGAADDYFGSSVSISGDRAIISAFLDDDNGKSSGSAYIFKWNGTAWVEEAKLIASDGSAEDQFGYAVSIDSTRAIISAYLDDDNGTCSGSAYIFKWNGTAWVEEAKLTASDGAAGDQFGCSVSIDSNRAIISAFMDDDNGDNSGSAYIFKWDGAAWVEEAKLTASDGAAGDQFGCSVSIDGDRAVIGAELDDDKGDRSGSAYVFKWDGTAWVEEAKLTASDGAAVDKFGYSVSIEGDRAVIGAKLDDDKDSSSGSAYVYNLSYVEAAYSATSLAFGGITVGEQAEQAFSVQNTGFANLVVSGLTLTGDGYTAAPDTFSLTRAQSQQVTVTFIPQRDSVYMGELIITHNGTSSPDTIGLSGTGLVPEPVYSPDTLQYGNVQVGQQVDLGFQVQNTGEGVLNVADISATSSDFTISSKILQVDPGQDTTITVTFASSEFRSYSEHLIITYNAPSSPDTTLLSGVGIEANVVCEPDSLIFPETQAGAQTTQFLYIQNNGAWAFPIDSVHSSVGDIYATGVVASIGAGQEDSISIVFAPSEVGAYSEYLVIYSKALIDPDTIIVEATGITPITDIALSDSSLTFSSIYISQQSARTFMVENTGYADLVVSDIQISHADFTAEPDTAALPPGETQEVTVTFAPQEVRTYNEIAVLTHNAASSPDTVLLIGEGIEPEIIYEPDTLVFPEIQVGEQSVRYLRIRNNGTIAFSIDSVHTSTGDVYVDRIVTSIGAGQVDSISFVFTPSEVRAYSEYLVLYSSTLAVPDTIVVEAVGLTPLPVVVLSDTSLTFPATYLNQQSTRTFDVGNTGQADLVLSDIHMTSADFTADSFPFVLLPGQVQTVTVTFSPHLTGAYSELAFLIHNGPSSPDTLTLSSTGLLPGAYMNFLAKFTVLPSFVNVLFQMTDQGGAGLTTLNDVALYDIRENGSAISETEALPKIGQMDQVPFKVKTVLMLDNSFSIGLDLGTLKTAALAVVDNMLPNQEIAVFTFSEAVALLQDFTHNVDSLRAAINSISLGPPSTNLYGAVIAGADHAQDVFSPEKIEQSYLIILTDGQDTQGSATLAEALAARGTKQVITIGVGSEADVNVLQQIQTAGYYTAADFSVLLQVFENIQQHIVGLANSFYWLVYVSPTRGANEHTLEIGLKNNPNTGANSTISVNFNSDGFYSVLPGVYVNRSFDRLNGIDSVAFEVDSASILLTAETLFGLLTPVYEWASGDTNIITVKPVEGDPTQAVATQVGQFGQSTTITISDVANSFSKVLYATVSQHGSLPVAMADSVTTSEDTALTIFVLVNDADPDGATLTVVSVAQPAHGAAAIDAGDTTLTYTPSLNFTGTDSFTYVVSDGSDGLDTAGVVVTVISVNDPPEPFALLVPADGDTAEIVNDSLLFVWESSADVEGDTLVYHFHIYGLGYDTTIAGLVDTTLVLTGLAELALDSLYTWFVDVLDGTDTTTCLAEYQFRMPSVLALDPLALIPAAFALHQNYPNPFNPSTTLRFDLPQAAEVYLVVYDLLGREVVRLADGRLKAGYHSLIWNGRDARGREVPTGMYIVLMVTPEYTKSIKMLLLK